MIDKLNRKVEYMRISVMDRCNLRCAYCMPEEGIANILHEEILSYYEIILHYKKGIDLKEPIRNNITDKELENIIYHAIRNKPLGHNFYHNSNIENLENKSMVQIGG